MDIMDIIEVEEIKMTEFNFDLFCDLIQSQDIPQKIVDIFENYIDYIDATYVSIVYTISKNPVHVQIIDQIFDLCIKYHYTSIAIQHFLDAWIDYWTTEPNLLLNYASPSLFKKFKEMLSHAVYHLRDQNVEQHYQTVLKKTFNISLECTG